MHSTNSLEELSGTYGEDGYQCAYKETTYYEMHPDRVDEVGTTFEWDLLGKEAFLAAHVTWECVIDRGVPLKGLCDCFRTEMDVVMAQNEIKDPDKITAGQRITYDSKKTRTENTTASAKRIPPNRNGVIPHSLPARTVPVSEPKKRRLNVSRTEPRRRREARLSL